MCIRDRFIPVMMGLTLFIVPRSSLLLMLGMGRPFSPVLSRIVYRKRGQYANFSYMQISFRGPEHSGTAGPIPTVPKKEKRTVEGSSTVRSLAPVNLQTQEDSLLYH